LASQTVEKTASNIKNVVWPTLREFWPGPRPANWQTSELANWTLSLLLAKSWVRICGHLHALIAVPSPTVMHPRLKLNIPNAQTSTVYFQPGETLVVLMVGNPYNRALN